MRQRFDQNYAQKFQLEKKEYASFLDEQIRSRADRNREDKILNQALDQNLFHMPRSRYQITSLYYDSDFARRQKRQQQIIEQDIFNYNQMVAEQKRLLKQQQKELEQQQSQQWEQRQDRNQLKLPKILINSSEYKNGKNSPNSGQKNLSKSYILSQSPILNSSNLTYDYSYDEDRLIQPSKDPEQIDQNEVDHYEQRLKTEMKKRNEKLEAIRIKMHENYISTKNQITSLLEFIKYNQQQQSQYEILTKQLSNMMKEQKAGPSYPYLREELKRKMENDKIFHFNEFQEQINEEIKNTSNYVIFEKNEKEKIMSEQQDQIYLEI